MKYQNQSSPVGKSVNILLSPPPLLLPDSKSSTYEAADGADGGGGGTKPTATGPTIRCIPGCGMVRARNP